MKEPILFIWIPKNAGTSTYTALNNRYGMKLIIDNYHKWDNKGNVTFGHADVTQLLSMKTISQEYWRSASKFVIVRNPYDRFVSLWQDFIRSNRIKPDTTLASFAHSMLHMTRKPGLFNVMDFSQCASQVDWIPIDAKILRYETIRNELLFEFKAYPPFMNVNDGVYSGLEFEDKFNMLYDKETALMVAELYYEDFTVLGYEF